MYPTDNGSEKEHTEIETDVPKETGYLGDVDTCSSESSEPQSSDSEDDISTTSSKGKTLKPELGSQFFHLE